MVHFGNLHNALTNIALLQVSQELLSLLGFYREIKFVDGCKIEDLFGLCVEIQLLFTGVIQVNYPCC